MILLYTFSFARGQELLYYKTAKHTFRIVTMTVVCICVVTSPQTAVMTCIRFLAPLAVLSHCYRNLHVVYDNQSYVL